MNTCPINTLQIHSSGGTYAAIDYLNHWRLENAAGDVLTGYRGKIYAFKSKLNAETWLCSNLARVKNAAGVTPADFVGKLHVIYSQHLAAYVLAEIQAIAALDAGLWSPFLCDECDCSNEPIDGGNAESIYTEFINP